MFLTISLLLSVLTRVWLVAKEHKKKFQILARTDSLTNIYNRYGFDEFAEKMIQKNPKAHFVAALLDIDDFKFINDIYGHNYGDRALKNLADSMKTFFPSDALLGRNGGDEFCILLPNCTFAEADIQLQKFTKLPKSFSYHGKEHAFYISLGYAEYPTFASNRSQLMRCADAALYEIKLHGKNGCMVYREGLRSGARKQLGFAFKDISEHLPGAFIIYRADKEDDELFFANDEFLHMSGYKDIDELFRLTEKSFRNLIREDEQQQIESSIWEQIDNGNENDYRYSNLNVLNPYHGVTIVHDKGHTEYIAKLHLNGNYLIGRFPSLIEAAIAYNKAVDLACMHGCTKQFPQNYIDSLSSKEYLAYYKKITLPDRLLSYRFS